jgi:hypothetical protein
MRAREFTVNVPITITINGDEDPVVSAGDQEKEPDLQKNPVMVPPLQQHIELQKAELGKESPVIDKMTQDDNIGAEPDEQDSEETPDELQRLLQLLGR